MDVFLELVWVNGRYRDQGPQLQRFLAQNCARVTIFVTKFRVFSAAAISGACLPARRNGPGLAATAAGKIALPVRRAVFGALARRNFAFNRLISKRNSAAYPNWGMRDPAFHPLLPVPDTLQSGNFITYSLFKSPLRQRGGLFLRQRGLHQRTFAPGAVIPVQGIRDIPGIVSIKSGQVASVRCGGQAGDDIKNGPCAVLFLAEVVAGFVHGE
ncbi:hypothetical protein ADU59_12005 [Pararhizobium polonicum]|uniref:Uncharacterized protein n=1 Tax=Pararhizobium polonicum TaxID=1612624 RepID=A0A1C7P1X9_9HYPH|nr:hypothetical protein [Pararhizobium polonicum]OBZ95303.1 hypothetical protein ADU59_12005 [Pararhizobium polonicum]